MDEKFLFGIVLGMLGGAVLVTNSVKARQLVREGQDQVKEKVSKMSKPTKKSGAN
jgi:hypothetical protein